MITSAGMKKKAFKNIQYSFLLKTFNKLGLQGSNIIEIIYEKPLANIILTTNRLNTFFQHQKQNKNAYFCHICLSFSQSN